MKTIRSRIIIGSLLVILDTASICLALFTAYHVRFFSRFTVYFPVTKGVPSPQFYLEALVFVIPLLLFVFTKNDFYKIYFIPFLDELVRSVKAMTVGIFFLVMATFFYREVSYSRLTFVLFWFFLIIFVVVYREAFKVIARLALYRILKRENVLIIGRENRMLKTELKKHPYLQSFYFPEGDADNIEKIKNTIVEKGINQVIFVQHNWNEQSIMDFYDWCENKSVDLKFVPDLVQLCKGEVIIDSSFGIPIFHLRSVSFDGFNYFLKRTTDLIVSILILSAIWPVLLFVVILIKMDSKGPIFYHHKRMGYRGRIFNFYKFRTMVVDADNLLEQFKAKSERKGPVFKMSNDPRVTKVGKALRRFSIDELPQLINVLKGDMSISGPRPQVLWEAKAYDDWAKRRLRILPGITGLWQISGRASLSYEEMIELDIYYIENWSVGLDLMILCKTLPAIFSKKGAY